MIIPGGFGTRGVEGKIKAIQYVRENKIPYFGLCYGMQLAVIEYARNILGIKDANTKEMDKNGKNLIIDVMQDQRIFSSSKNGRHNAIRGLSLFD